MPDSREHARLLRKDAAFVAALEDEGQATIHRAVQRWHVVPVHWAIWDQEREDYVRDAHGEVVLYNDEGKAHQTACTKYQVAIAATVSTYDERLAQQDWQPRQSDIDWLQSHQEE